MNKKIIIAILVCTFVLSLIPAYAQECSLSIKNPENGAVISNEEFDAEIEVIGEVSYLSVKLNGEKAEYENTEGVIKCKINSEKLFLGKNTLYAVAVFSNGVSKRTVCEFSVAEQNKTLVSSYSFSGGLPSNWDKGLKIPTDSGDSVSCKISEGIGVGGEGDVAVKFSLPDSDNISTSRTTHSTYILQTTPVYTTPIELEYDLYLSTDKYSFYHETKNDKNSYAFIHNSKQLFGAGGIVDHSINEKYPQGYKYPVGEWMHVKHFIDFTNGVGSMWIDDNLIFENVSQGVNGTGMSSIKFQYDIAPPKVSSDSFYMIDNVQYNRVNKMFGITKAENGDNFINLYLDKALTDADKEDFKLYICKNEAEIADVLVNEAEKTVTITPKTALVPQSDCTVILSKEAYGSENDAIYNFKTNAGKISVDNVSFSGKNGEIYHTEALKNLDSINASVALSKTCENTAATVVFTVYSGNMPTEVKVKAVEYENGNPLPCVSSLALPEDKENVSVECFVIDSFLHGTPLSSVWSIARD